MLELDGKRVTVMGLGRFGGGVGVTRFLAEQGADVTLTDRAGEAGLRESVAAIEDLIASGSVQVRFGEHNVSDFTTCDLVVASPAVPRPWENRFLRAAAAADVPITTEIGLLIERLPTRERVIGVTGSAGKSTTSAMIAHGLRASGRSVWLGGNIGGSLLDDVPRIGTDDWVVLELSSAMLHWLCGWSPHVAVLTNLAPNHLDWHGTMEHYTESKSRILSHQRSGDLALFGEMTMPFAAAEGVVVMDPRRIDVGDKYPSLRVPGEHNRCNAFLAACAGSAATGEPVAAMLEAICGFAGLPHRLEFVGEFGGIRCFNDSKSTTPESAVMALDAMEDIGAVHLIAGGYDKGVDLGPLAARARSCEGVWTIGATGGSLADAIGGTAHECGTLDVAVERALESARDGQAILLSPGCASWDQFANFEKRGGRFVELVRAWSRSAEGVG